MEAKEIISDQSILDLCKDYPLLDFSCLDDYRQEFQVIVEISYKAGIREVVEWVDDNHGNCPGTMEYLAVNGHKWQAFKESKGDK
jgi:hypothetical protein